jgi:thiamine biosynthesis lipoprotein ApbE
MTTLEARWSALGTSVHVLVTEPAAMPAVRAAVDRVLVAVDETYSRFRPDSELRRLAPRQGGLVPVSPLLAQAVDAALRAARQTDGAVDPTVGRALRAIGYDADFAELAGRRAPIKVRLESAPGWRHIRLDAVRRMLEIPRGVELDLGSTGKALAADLAAGAALAEIGSGGVLVNLGGDIATAGTAPSAGWRVLAADDARTRPDAPGEVIALHGGALATSSTSVRRWSQGTVERHHIVDPATGAPAGGPWRSVSVVAATCVDANAAATSAIVRGRTAVPWLERLGLPARLVSTAGDVTRVAGWPTPIPGSLPEPLEVAS